jgi:chorismate mutase
MTAGPFVALAVLLCVGAPAAGVSQANDPVRDAKNVVRQGELQLAQMRQEIRNENYDAALLALQEYRDAVKSAHAELKESGRDAEKKPSGFKDLQIHIRRSIPRLEQSILSVPVEQREPFEAIRKELDKIDRELIDALFPRQPSKKAGEDKPARRPS